jgi:putative chitinase
MRTWIKKILGIFGRNTVAKPVEIVSNGETIDSLPSVTEENSEQETKTETISSSEVITTLSPEVVSSTDIMNKTIFFDYLRNTLFPKRLKPNQVKGIEAILDVMSGSPTSWIAYALATAYHETNKNMKPNTENLNYSVQGLLNTFGRHRISVEDAQRLGRKPGEGPLPVERQKAIANIIYGGEWGRINLGNIHPNDGWTYRGRGMDHCTGRANYQRTGNDIGVDLINNPEALLVLDNAVKALYTGMLNGRYAGDNRGRHTFARHLPSEGNANRQQFRNARKIINGTDKNEIIADYALIFQEALNKSGYKN